MGIGVVRPPPNPVGVKGSDGAAIATPINPLDTRDVGLPALIGALDAAAASGDGSLNAVLKRIRDILTDVWDDAADRLRVAIDGAIEIDVGPDEADDGDVATGSTDTPRRLVLNYVKDPSGNWTRLEARGPIATEAKQDNLITAVQAVETDVEALVKEATFAAVTGTTSDAGTTAGGAGTISAKLRKVTSQLNDLANLIGEVAGTPTANTVLARLKNIRDELTTLNTTDFATATKQDAQTTILDDIRTAVQLIDNIVLNGRAKTSPIFGEDGVDGGEGPATAKTTRVALTDEDKAKVQAVTDELGDHATDKYETWASLKVLNGDASVIDEVRRDDANDNATLYSYHGRAPDGTATAAASWEVMRFTHLVAGDSSAVARIQYLTGVAWDDRDSAGWS